MQHNILKLHLNKFVILFTFLNYQHFYMSRIIHFEIIETIIETLHIALISIYGKHI